MNAKKPNPALLFFFKHLHRLMRFLNRQRMKLTGDKRPGSGKYPAGDSFRAIADHIYEEGIDLDPAIVKAGDTVFVSNSSTLIYLKNIHPKIQHPYVLISHNGDYDMDKSIVDLLDDKIVRFYAQDAVYKSDKVIPIPIGLENKHYYTNGIPWVLDLFTHLSKKETPRKNKILYRFSVHTNPGFRKPLLAYFEKQSIMETFTEMLPPIMNLMKLRTYKFVASPRGNSIESSRTWEALYLKTVPVVQDFFAMKYFESLGLPMWVIHDWEELSSYTEDDLAKKYDELMSGANFEALYMDFWIKMIRKDQELARQKALA
jgi:hypothetical protein